MNVEPISTVDSIAIQIINIAKYQKQFNQFYLDNNWILNSTDLNNPDVNIYRVSLSTNTRETICYTTHSGTRHNNQTYTTFKFNGLKSYHKRKDKIEIMHC